LLSLGIGIAPPQYLHPWSFSITPLGIAIPSFLVSAFPLPRYRHPALSTLPSSVSVSLALWHRRYQASVSLSCLRTPSSSSASASSSTGFVSSLPHYNQYHRYSYTPTNLLIETHEHSLRNRALYSYTAAQKSCILYYYDQCLASRAVELSNLAFCHTSQQGMSRDLKSS
jgi:hypothetical protein